MYFTTHNGENYKYLLVVLGFSRLGLLLLLLFGLRNNHRPPAQRGPRQCEPTESGSKKVRLRTDSTVVGASSTSSVLAFFFFFFSVAGVSASCASAASVSSAFR